MDNLQNKHRPSPADFAGNPGQFINAMRLHADLSFRELAEQVKSAVRGKHRQGSENYFYRLCNEQTSLKPAVVDGLSRALHLTETEARFLEVSAQTDGQQGKSLLKVLAQNEDAALSKTDNAKAMIDPLVMALYTLAGKNDLSLNTLERTLAKAASSKKAKTPVVRQAIQLLERVGLIETDSSTMTQVSDQSDLAIHSSSELSNQVKANLMKVFYANLDEWGIDALFGTDRTERYFQSSTFLVDQEDLETMNQELAESWTRLKNKLRKKYETQSGNSVVHVGVRSWPMITLQDDSN